MSTGPSPCPFRGSRAQKTTIQKATHQYARHCLRPPGPAGPRAGNVTPSQDNGKPSWPTQGVHLDTAGLHQPRQVPQLSLSPSALPGEPAGATARPSTKNRGMAGSSGLPMASLPMPPRLPSSLRRLGSDAHPAPRRGPTNPTAPAALPTVPEALPPRGGPRQSRSSVHAKGSPPGQHIAGLPRAQADPGQPG